MPYTTIHLARTPPTRLISSPNPVYPSTQIPHLLSHTKTRSRHSPRPRKLIPRPPPHQLHLTGADRRRIQRLPALPARMAQLRHKQTPTLLRDPHQLPIPLQPPVMVVAQDRVPQRLDRVVLHHRVALHDNPDPALAPAAVQVDQLRRRHAAARDVIVAPVAQAFGHGGFQESVRGAAAGEGECDWLAE